MGMELGFQRRDVATWASLHPGLPNQTSTQASQNQMLTTTHMLAKLPN